MTKFKVKLELQGLKLEIEGSREDIPLINQAIGNQVAGLLNASNDIVEGEVVSPEKQTAAPAVSNDGKNTKKKSNSRKTKPQNNAPPQDNTALSWRHEPEKWGTPTQGWKTAQKSIWLLYVVTQELNVKELTTGEIVKTFNAQFKQSGQIYERHVGRELGRLKITKTAPISEDTTGSTNKWFLTQAGEKIAKGLILEARGEQSNGKSES